MLDYKRLNELAEECGFSITAPLDISALEFMQEVRDMCNAEMCKNYNKSWSCPPACDSLEKIRTRAAAYVVGILVQTVGQLDDSYDWDGIMRAGAQHKSCFSKLRHRLESDFSDVLAMGMGECRICDSCAYPGAPCRHPDKMEVSMEANGLLVSKVCTDNGLAYNYGSDKIAFTSCFLIN